MNYQLTRLDKNGHPQIEWTTLAIDREKQIINELREWEKTWAPANSEWPTHSDVDTAFENKF